MTLWRPPQIPYLSDFLFGHWPDGDEDAMRRAAGHWSEMAKALKDLQKPADQAMVDALDAVEGKAHQAMASYWQDISGGDGSDLQRLITVCESYAEQLEHGATDIEHTKLTIYISAMVMLAMTAWSWVPGAGQAAEVATAAAVKVTIRAAVQKLLSEIATKGALFVAKRLGTRLAINVGTQAAVGAGLGAATDAAAQGIQLAADHRQGGFDWGSLWGSVGSGALAGGISGPASDGAGHHIADKLASGVEPGIVAKLVGKNVAEIPANLAGNAASQVAFSENHSVSADTLFDGAGGGLTSGAPKHGPQTHGDPTPGTHPDAAAERPSSADAGTSPASDSAQPADQSHPGSGTTPAAADAPAAPPGTGSEHASTTAAGHEESDTSQPDSKVGQNGDTRAPASDSRPNTASPSGSDAGSGQQTPAQTPPSDRSAAGPAPMSDRAAAPASSQAAASDRSAAPVQAPASDRSAAPAQSPVPDRAAASAQPSSPGAATGDRQMPTGRAAPDSAPRVDAPPSGDRGAQPHRPAEVRSPGADVPERRNPESPAAASAPRADAAPVRPPDPVIRPDAGTRPDPAHRPQPAAARPEQPRTDNGPARDRAPGADAHPDSAPSQPDSESGTSTDRRDSTPNPETHRHGGPEHPAGDRTPAVTPGPQVSDRDRTGSPGTDRFPDAAAEPDPAAQPVPVVVAPVNDVAAPTRDSAGPGRETASATERAHGTDQRQRVIDSADQATAVPSQSGGATRPGNPLDIAAQDTWAGEAYDTIRASDTDVRDMIENLSTATRPDGSTGFGEHEIEQAKQHLFEDEHKLSVFDDEGTVVGYENRRFDADPDIAEAWMRLSRGEPLPADITLLEHELTQAAYLREHPDASYREAHAHANTKADWESDIPERTGENYQKWGEDDGAVRDLPEDGGNRDRGDLPVREQRDGTEPGTGDREGGPGRRSGGRNERPADVESGRTHPGSEGQRPELAGRGRDSSLSEGAEEPPKSARSGDRPPDIAGLRFWSRDSNDDAGGSRESAARPGSSWDPSNFVDESGPGPHLTPDGRLPVEKKPFHANPKFRDDDAARRHAADNPRIQEGVGAIRAGAERYPDLYRLDAADVAVIRSYQDGSVCERVNNATREGLAPVLREADTEIRALVSALNKLPDHRGTVRRGIMISDPAKLSMFLEAYEVGETPTDHGFGSSDKDVSAGGNIELIIESHHGKDISWATAQQNEVLFPPGHTFYVQERSVVRGREPWEDKHVIVLTDLGRNPDERELGRHRLGRAEESGGADTRPDPAGRERVPRGPGPDGRTPEMVGRAGREERPAGYRTAEEELAGLGRFGTTTDRTGAGRPSEVGPYSTGAPSNSSGGHETYRNAHDGMPWRAPESRGTDTGYPDNRFRAPESRPAPPVSPVPPGNFPRPDQFGGQRQWQQPMNGTGPAPAHGPGHPAEPAHSSATSSPRPAGLAPTHGAAPGRPVEPPPATTRGAAPSRPADPPHPNEAPPSRRPVPAGAAEQRGPDPVPPHSDRPEAPSEPPGPHPDTPPRAPADAPPPTHPDRPTTTVEQQPLSESAPDAGDSRPVRPTEPPTDGGPPLRVTRTEDSGGGQVSDMSVKVYLDQRPGVENEHMRQVATAARAAADEIAGPNHRLPWGDQPKLSIEFVSDPAVADISAIVEHGTSSERGVWSTEASPEDLAGRIREQLGLPADHDGRIGLSADDIQALSDRIAEANTHSPLRGLPDTREVGTGKLAPLEDPAYQEDLRNALREGDHFTTFFDPRTHEAGGMVNDGGPEVPGRRNSCGDNIMAGLSCLYGDPQVSHPRHADRLPDGSIDDFGPEIGVIDRISDWLGADWQTFTHEESPPAGFTELHDLIDGLGPGSSAAVAVGFHARDPETTLPLYHADGSPVIEEGHGVIVVYPRDAEGPVWWDPLTGEASDRPFPHLVEDAASLHAIPLGKDAKPYAPHTDSEPGGGRALSGEGAGATSEVPDVPVRTGVGGLSDPVAGGDRPGAPHRPDEDGAGLPHGGDHRVPESAGPDGRREVHVGDHGGHPDARRPDLPAAQSTAPHPEPVHPGQSGVPDPARVPDRGPSDRELPARDGQANPDRPATGNHEHDGRVVDRGTAASDRDLAAAGDRGVLGDRGNPPLDVGHLPDDSTAGAGREHRPQAQAPSPDHRAPLSNPPVPPYSRPQYGEGPHPQSPQHQPAPVPPHRSQVPAPPRENANIPRSPDERLRSHNSPQLPYDSRQPVSAHPHDSVPAPGGHDPRQGRRDPVQQSPVPPHPVAEPQRAREYYRGQHPENNQVIPVRAHRENPTPSYDVRRYPNAPGGPITVVRVRAYVTGDAHIPPEHLHHLWDNAQFATDRAFNQGHHLASGDRVLVDLVQTPDPTVANVHMHVSDRPGYWHPGTSPEVIAKQLHRHLGLPPEHYLGFGENSLRELSSAIAGSYPGGHEAVPGRGIGHEPRVPDPVVRTGHGGPPDPVRAGHRPEPPVGHGAPRREGSDHRPHEPASGDGRPAVRDGDHGTHPDVGRLEQDRGGMDHPSETSEPRPAQRGDRGEIGERDDVPHTDGAEGSRPEHGHDGEHTGSEPEADRSDPLGRPAEPEPRLRDLFPPSGLPVDEARVLPLARQALDGEYGGLRASVDTVSGNSGKLNMTFKVYDEDGNQVGYASRSFSNTDGHIIAEHVKFTLDENVQGSGFAGEFHEVLFGWYGRSGVEEVMLRANIDVGSYAWARQGFEFRIQQQACADVRPNLNREISRMRLELQQLQQEQAHLPEHERTPRIGELEGVLEKADEIMSRFVVGDSNFPTPLEISVLGRPDDLSPGESRDLMWPGKRVFLEPEGKVAWHGVKKIHKELR
ncbi:toxin glutamine deamidase domain-containing protein [Nocardia sp. NPDC052254]|uniref:WXG100-like domain-containing protein n=1 Tax=Nocardia sp. NPDC052254 TaxID=3155681 RepID=UPI003428B826